jgi:hypothetical protein
MLPPYQGIRNGKGRRDIKLFPPSDILTLHLKLIGEQVRKKLNRGNTIKSHLQETPPANQLKAKKMLHLWDFLDLVNQEQQIYEPKDTNEIS